MNISISGSDTRNLKVLIDDKDVSPDVTVVGFRADAGTGKMEVNLVVRPTFIELNLPAAKPDQLMIARLKAADRIGQPSAEFEF